MKVNPKEVSKAVSQSRVSSVGRGRADVAQRLPNTPATTEARGYPDGETSQGVDKVDQGENPALTAFWQPLRDACYDTW